MVRGWPRMVSSVILGFYPGCDVNSFPDGRGWSRGWPRMVLRIILGFCGGYSMSDSRDDPGWLKGEWNISNC